MSDQQFAVGVLGATGAVGQKFIRLLEGHPWFTIKKLGASERSAGKPYFKAANWIESTPLPDAIKDVVVDACTPESFEGVDFVFSGLDSSVAGEIEGAFAKAGIPVISNAKNYRMYDHVPLLVPEVNPDHIALIDHQDFDPNGKGFIVTNPNCVSVPLSMALKPLADTFGVTNVVLTSIQAISGAGYPGVPSLDIMGNIIPNIGGEEPKVAAEPIKLLGKLNGDKVDNAHLPIQATTVRAPVLEGHTLAVSLNLSKDGVTADDVKKAYADWENPIAKYNLPFAPEHPIFVTDDEFGPQPRKASYTENGMRTTIGRIRETEVMDISFIALAHNTVRGAAGGAILNAELLVKKGYIG